MSLPQKLKIILFGFFAILYFPRMSFSDCGNTVDHTSSVDLRQPGKSMHGVPVLEQDGMAFCYSFAATTLVNAYIRSKKQNLSQLEKDKFLISPIVMGLIGEAIEQQKVLEEFQNKGSVTPIYSNSVCAIANLIKTYGACSLIDASMVIDKKIQKMDSCDLPPSVNPIRWLNGGPLVDILSKIDGIGNSARRSEKALNSLNSLPFVNKNFIEKSKGKNLEKAFQELQNVQDALQVGLQKDYLWPKYDKQEAELILRSLPDEEGVKSQDLKSGGYLRNFSYPLTTVALLVPECMQLDENGKAAFKGHFQLGQKLGVDGIEIPNFSRCFDTEKRATDTRYINAPPDQNKKEGPIQLLNALNSRLDLRDQPVGVSFCWTFLVDSKTDGAYWKEERSPILGRYNTFDFKRCKYKGKSEGDHKSVIVGRRLNNNRCEYLLRNSWGNECTMYTGEYKKSCEDELQKNGLADVWIPGDILSRSMHGYSYLD